MQSLQYKFVKLNKYYYNGIILIYDNLYNLIKFPNKNKNIPLQYYKKSVDKNIIEKTIINKVKLTFPCKINTSIKYKHVDEDNKEINWLYLVNNNKKYGFSDIYIDMILNRLNKININYELKINLDETILLFNDKSELFNINPLIVVSCYYF